MKAYIDRSVYRVRARERELLDRLDQLPLSSAAPSPTPDLVRRLAAAVPVYPARIYHAVVARAERYDAAWGFRGESELAAFLDFQCLRRVRSLRTFLPVRRDRRPAWQELTQQMENPS